MFRKIVNLLAVYSNGILILLIVLSFIGLISVTSRSRRDTLAKIIQLNTVLVRDDDDVAEWLKVRCILGGVHAGAAGRELALAASGYDLALERFARPGRALEQSRSELRNSLGNVILAYTDLLRRREAAFDSLYSFLVVGILIQSFALMINLGRVGTAWSTQTRGLFCTAARRKAWPTSANTPRLPGWSSGWSFPIPT